MQILLWIGDAVILLGVIPIAVLLLVRVILALVRAHGAIVHIGQSAQAITEALPPALSEVSTLADTVERLRPERSTLRAPSPR